VKRRMHLVAVAGGIALASATVAVADRGRGGADGAGKRSATRVFTLDPSTHGNPEGVAVKDHGRVFFVGATGDGTIYRGTIDDPMVREFIPGEKGKSAIGIEASDNKLYVAGGTTGNVLVYDLRTKEVVASFATGSGGFLNDLVVTGKGDVFVTDSFRPTLWHITAEQVQAGSGTPAAIPVGPEIVYQDGFNLNGIVPRRGGRQLIVVQGNTGALFRIDLDEDAPNGREITRIDADPLPGGDGLLLDDGRLIVVQGPTASLRFLRLEGGASRAELVNTRTDPSLRGPSTVDRARHLYLVVNADFAQSRTPFTVSGLPAKQHD
jgi:DNA-binding beta-propeller fold protein YncE